ncbi:MAG: methylmalonyl Co-A mutase-associated GTPase MeaB [Actinobacteria bacterium]|nr:methylmalonyl Co-A mutase-associated GTPase MeaB [Actinomycetota bacterium]
MKDSPNDLYRKLLEGDRRAAARLITMVENADPQARQALEMLHRHSGGGHIVGLTGSPGSGKSTLTCRLARHYRDEDRTVGIICVDPSSPFTGGALLGDRVRMQELSGDPGVFIRSMGSRGALGGLSVATNDVINILDAFGKDVIIVETVGAGQVEIEVVKYAHTCIVVTMPGGGDEIQAIKAGILEIGDIFVVNKSDRDGAPRAVADLEMMLETKPGIDEEAWKPPVISTVALSGEGVGELADAIAAHRAFLVQSGLMEEKTVQRMKAELLEILKVRVSRAAENALDEDEVGAGLIGRMSAREIDPHSAADEIVEYLFGAPDSNPGGHQAAQVWKADNSQGRDNE